MEEKKTELKMIKMSEVQSQEIHYHAVHLRRHVAVFGRR